MQKTYVITGSTSGIGKALLEEYSKDNLVLAGYRNESKKIEGENIVCKNGNYRTCYWKNKNKLFSRYNN